MTSDGGSAGTAGANFRVGIPTQCRGQDVPREHADPAEPGRRTHPQPRQHEETRNA